MTAWQKALVVLIVVVKVADLAVKARLRYYQRKLARLRLEHAEAQRARDVELAALEAEAARLNRMHADAVTVCAAENVVAAELSRIKASMRAHPSNEYPPSDG